MYDSHYLTSGEGKTMEMVKTSGFQGMEWGEGGSDEEGDPEAV